MSLETNATSSQIILGLVGEPVIDQFHGYRVIIDWNKPLLMWLIDFWPNVTWENTITPKSNFTICYAGGVSGYDIVNGSYSEFYNKSGSLLYSEVNNNTVVTNNNSIIFTVNQTLVPNTLLNPHNSTLGFTTFNAIVFTNYNTTITETITNGSPTISSVIWMDALPDNVFVGNLFIMGSLPNSNVGINSLIIISTFVMTVTSYLLYEKRKLRPK